MKLLIVAPILIPILLLALSQTFDAYKRWKVRNPLHCSSISEAMAYLMSPLIPILVWLIFYNQPGSTELQRNIANIFSGVHFVMFIFRILGNVEVNETGG